MNDNMSKETHAIYTAINAGLFEAYGYCENEDYTVTDVNYNSFVINYKNSTSIKISVDEV